MTAYGLLGELATWTGLADPSPASATPTAAARVSVTSTQVMGVVDHAKIREILDVCDRMMGEASLRQHAFDWLVLPGGDPHDQPVVDAYYPGRNLVVLCQQQTEAHRALCAELVPAYGLGLLKIDLAAFRDDSETAYSFLIPELEAVREAMPPVFDDMTAS
ncbi:MAG: hypothetical protein QOJ25_87, partial [Solirubrobacteraceae bacterium]|nr:hypothetical protein [Solirubrobacteraceae bacterium]